MSAVRQDGSHAVSLKDEPAHRPSLQTSKKRESRLPRLGSRSLSSVPVIVGSPSLEACVRCFGRWVCHPCSCPPAHSTVQHQPALPALPALTAATMCYKQHSQFSSPHASAMYQKAMP